MAEPAVDRVASVHRAAELESDSPSPRRLVIRVKIVRDEPLPRGSGSARLRRIAVLSVVGVFAVALTWVGFSAFKKSPAPVPVASESVTRARSRAPVPTRTPAQTSAQRPAQVSAEMPAQNSAHGAARTSAQISAHTSARVSAETPAQYSAHAPAHTPSQQASARTEPATPPDAQRPQQSDAPPSSRTEVIPNVPRSARDTIRGTVRVSVRVIVNKEGSVAAATPDDGGPSRYFERLALEAAKKWTFTPTTSQAQRVMLLRFNFTRDDTTARASEAP